MKRTLAFLLLAIVMRVQATVVNLREGSCQVPDEMQEMSAEQIKEFSPKLGQLEQIRAFIQYDPEKKRSMSIICAVQPAPKSLCSLRALREGAKEKPEQLKKEIQEGFLESSGTQGSVTDAEIDIPNQAIVIGLSSTEDGIEYKSLCYEVPVNDNKIMTTRISVDRVHFDELLPTMVEIGRSLKAYPQFKLSEDSSATLANIRLGFLASLSVIAVPAIWAFYRRKQSRWWILCVSIISLLVFLANGGYLIWILAIIWAICGRVKSRDKATSISR